MKENLLFPVQNHTHPHWKDDFEWISETLDLKKMMNSQIQKLSGGEKQRLALARALIFRPRMLLLDEPFSSMDESLRGRAREMVLKASEHLKCPVLLITHDRKDVEAMAQKVSQIEKGRLVSESKTL